MKIYFTYGPVDLLDETKQKEARDISKKLTEAFGTLYQFEECRFERDPLGWA